MDFTLYLPITSLTAILNAALLVTMTSAIGLIRNRTRISYGDAGDARFAKRIRGHANAVEQIPIALILLALAELQGASAALLWSAAAGLTFGRLLHAAQFWFRGVPFAARPVGVVLTLAAQAILIVWLAVYVAF
ncbi:MAG: MAPEG family protein [Rhodobacteraceae bacterium]|nr:MAPEG family protein [Paracoccaceae bacterium]